MIRMIPGTCYIINFNPSVYCFVVNVLNRCAISDNDIVVRATPCGCPFVCRGYSFVCCHLLGGQIRGPLIGQARGLPLRGEYILNDFM